ncbi:MAG: hypothetical protein ACOX22_06210 [Caldicoprobacterales bacterium]
MRLDIKAFSKGMIYLSILIFIIIVTRISVTVLNNHNLANTFTPSPSEPYQQQMPISEEGFIDDYIYRLYSPFAVAPIGRPNTFVLNQPISYFSAPDDNLKPAITLEAGKTYIINTNDKNDYKYGIKSWPTYKKGWRYVIPFVEVGDEKLIPQAYYVKLKDLIPPLKLITGGLRYLPKGYNYRRTLLINDEMLYKEGYYLSPDLYNPIIDVWNITLFIGALCLIIVRKIVRIKIGGK